MRTITGTLALLVACKADNPPLASEEAKAAIALPSCVADNLGPIFVGERAMACRETQSCALSCGFGDGRACFEQALVEQDANRNAETPERRASETRYFGFACRLGFALGCTNAGAAVFLDKDKDRDACAGRLFAHACAVGDPYGCGMYGRYLAIRGTTDAEARAVQWFEAACRSPAGAACRLYALAIEYDEVTDTPPGHVADLLRRACATGDDDACDVKTATGSF